mmetsp:Transcript_52658/g.145609  ORF Transcript_52658/g.145609 Transcript_52658/m.145609 type:complete len:92 (+) Transcript_52658:2153-2428(+)
MARHVQRRVLLDVVVNDFGAVAANELRQPDEGVVDLFHSLRRSPYEEVRAEANEIKHAFEQMLERGMQTEQHEVANRKHLERLCDLLDGYS